MPALRKMPPVKVLLMEPPVAVPTEPPRTTAPEDVPETVRPPVPAMTVFRIRLPLVERLSSTRSLEPPVVSVPPVSVWLFAAAVEPTRMPPLVTVLVPVKVSVRAEAALNRREFVVPAETAPLTVTLVLLPLAQVSAV